MGIALMFVGVALLVGPVAAPSLVHPALGVFAMILGLILFLFGLSTTAIANEVVVEKVAPKPFVTALVKAPMADTVKVAVGK